MSECLHKNTAAVDPAVHAGAVAICRDCGLKTPAPRQSVLTEAQGLVHGDRNASYGPPIEDFSRTAGMVSAMLGHKLREPLTAEEIGMVMCCVKLSRQMNKPKRDNMTDLAGYAECVQWIVDERQRREAGAA